MKGRFTGMKKGHNIKLGILLLASVSLLAFALFFVPIEGASGQMSAYNGLKLEPASPVEKISVEEVPSLQLTAAPRTSTPMPEPVVVTASSTKKTSAKTSASSTASSPAPSGDELSKAQSILASYISKYPILSGTTVSFGDAQGYQAICYYKSGRIVISSSHTASLDRIIGHEIWHVIDWRDNGVIDWGENVPPK